MARGAAAIAATPQSGVAWFSRIATPVSPQDRCIAIAYAAGLGLQAGIANVPGWAEAEDIIRDPQSADGWWAREEAERRVLMEQTTAAIGQATVLDALTAALEGHAEQSHACALEAGANEAMAKVASGAALMALNNRALALLAGRGADHAFVQKYALFEAGRWPLGLRASTFILF